MHSGPKPGHVVHHEFAIDKLAAALGVNEGAIRCLNLFIAA